MTSDEQLELLASIVALRIQQRTVSELVRQALVAVDRRLVSLMPRLIRKRVAARLLEVSVQGLDRWIAKGELRAEPIEPASSRQALPLGELLELAVEVALARRNAAAGAKVLPLAVAARRERRWLHAEVQSAHNLIVAGHTIMAGARASRDRGV